MSESLISDAARMLRTGDEFSSSNQKLRDAVNRFLGWFCPMMRDEQLPVRGWSIGHWGNGAWGIEIRTGSDTSPFVIRSDGYECTIQDYVYFACNFRNVRREIQDWMESQARIRRQLAGVIDEMRSDNSALAK